MNPKASGRRQTGQSESSHHCNRQRRSHNESAYWAGIKVSSLAGQGAFVRQYTPMHAV
jgi:hypothetical protein